MKRKGTKFYREHFPIDRHNLAEELPKHAELLAEVMREATFRKADLDPLRDRITAREAALYLEYRSLKEGTKLTEGEIKAKVQLDLRLRKMREKLRIAERRSAEWTALADAFRHRGYALRELTELRIHEMMDDPGKIASSSARRTRERKAGN